MVNRLCFRSGCILTVMLFCLSVTGAVSAKEKEIDICSLVSTEQLAGIYKKELFPTVRKLITADMSRDETFLDFMVKQFPQKYSES